MANELELLWHDRNDTIGDAGRPLNALFLGKTAPSINVEEARYLQNLSGSNRGCIIKANTFIKLIDSDGKHWIFTSGDNDKQITDLQTLLDTGTSFQAGKDYFIYLASSTPLSGASIVVSLNSTFPSGWTANNSRKIGGFHTLCADVGIITDHNLSGFVAGDIIPTTFWTLCFRAKSENNGMAYIDGLGLWMSIYLASYTDGKLASTFGAQIADGASTPELHWFNFVEIAGKQGLRLPWQHEFIVVAKGSNEGTNITGSADPVTTGGHVDTAGRRMVSNFGLEDMCGVEWQWLLDSAENISSATTTNMFKNIGDTGQIYYAEGYDVRDNQRNPVSLDGTNSYGKSWGQQRRALAGAAWVDAASCGSRASCWDHSPAHLNGYNGVRLASEPRVV